MIGLGYIGLPTATIIANNGIDVKGFDINNDVVRSINSGLSTIKEKDIEIHLKNALISGKFKAFNSPQKSDIYIFAVPTPIKEISGGIPCPDISILIKAFESILPLLKKNDLIIIESTSPIGTTEKIASILKKRTIYDLNDINFAYCPERVIPGKILEELISNDRVIGGLTQKATDLAIDFYSRFCKGKIFKSSAKGAEFVKLAENAYRDVNIAFANELSMLSKDLDLNVRDIISLANMHPRVNILNPGCGVGGHCIAVDPWFLVSQSPKKTPLIQAARFVNDKKTNWVFEQIISETLKINKILSRKPIIGCYGISFKPDVDDLRGSPSISIVEKLIDSGLEIMINEPNLKKHDKFILYPIDELYKKCDLHIFLVRHSQYLIMDINNLRFMDFCGIKN